jgi:hypothetical protein
MIKAGAPTNIFKMCCVTFCLGTDVGFEIAVVKSNGMSVIFACVWETVADY